jgi:hypothetical protein
MISAVQLQTDSFNEHKWAAWLTRRFARSSHGLEVKIAESREEMEGAFRLLYGIYSKAGYIKEHIQTNASELYVNLYMLLPGTRMFIVKKGEQVVATMSAVMDSSFGLPIDEIFPEEMTELRTRSSVPDKHVVSLGKFFWNSREAHRLVEFVNRQGARLAELTAFAQDVSVQATSSFLDLMKLAFKYGLMISLNSYVIEVTPNHAPFYQRFWRFKPFATGKLFPGDNAPAVAMSCDSLPFIQSFTKAEDGSGTMVSLLNVAPWEHRVLTSAVLRPVISPEILRYFLKEKTSVWEQTPQKMRESFRSLHARFGNDLSWAD